MSDENVKQIGVEVTIEQQAELERIKDYHGLKNNSEALRFLIRKEARAIRDMAPLFASAIESAIG